MATNRGAGGRFARKPLEELSPAYRRRIERAARQRRSLSQARGHGTTARPVWTSRDVHEREAYQKSLQVLSEMRQGKSLSRAAREVGVSPDTVRRYVGSAFEPRPGGRFAAKPSDRLYRRMKFLDERGQLSVEPANSREASKLAQYWAAVRQYLQDGDVRPLRRFERMRLRLRDKSVRRFVTDPDRLDDLARAGEVSFEDLYELSA